MQLLEGTKLAQKMQKELTEKTSKLFPNKEKYVGIIYLGEDKSSKVYVGLKQKYGEKIGIPVHIFGQYKKGDNLPNNLNNDYDVQLYMKQEYDNIGKVIDLINYLNSDKDCIGIIVQLPLPEKFKQYKAKILSTIAPDKDIDGLGGILTGLSSIDLIDFVPATPKAVINILQEYSLYNIRGKIITIIGQSNLVGKPLMLELVKQGGTVYSCNSNTPKEELKKLCKSSDYIISCTGVVHLLNNEFVR
ncbi:MAG TPA: bifunctional 5,10-methylenetetrahydrofolate dehydrogenase/5,10-methenyltetrahydrofolate cyclohydrolase, partial [Candidatus Absconditabacterales bacterium]|nr:bifunctional 5,10-methylenetetrahydrofolate dehydrogenase/5,10-methenyltetrahydrofolate cyclohydrolase [Candidatus Absconditabacterales bacterium]